MEDGPDCSPVSSRSTQVTLGHYTVPSMSPTPQTLSPTAYAMGVIVANPGVHTYRFGGGHSEHNVVRDATVESECGTEACVERREPASE